ncbi:hypothetical protein WR25_02797 [Diploscapter pachys]|uniref:F-box domain-containing protein n=1 Tax=Diploscapter pachys TaxID=2018661 RepID=A0A2A2LXX8_9BILA|nr:hypothetical protein WR25_02797 [Diploscapter pachys]
MLANLPVEIILLICEYPEFKDLGQLAWTNKRMMQIIKKHLPMALERKTLFYLEYRNGKTWEGRICLFDSHTNSVEQIAKFHNWYEPDGVATSQNKLLMVMEVERYIDYQTMNGNGLKSERLQENEITLELRR